MCSQWSLVLFTLLVQSVVGSVWCMQAAFILSEGRFGLFHFKFQLLAALFAIMTGLAAAITHLGKPGACFHAVRNFRQSWLSREIVAVNLLAGILFVMALLTFIRHGVLNDGLMAVASLTGGAALFIMTRVYRLRTVPSWNNAGTPINFLGSALLTGGLLFMVVLYITTAVQNIAPDVSGAVVSGNIAFITSLVGLMFKVAAASLNPTGRTGSAMPLKTSQPILQGCGVALWTVSILFGGGPGLRAMLFSLGAVGLIAGEVIHRIHFYEGYSRVGL